MALGERGQWRRGGGRSDGRRPSGGFSSDLRPGDVGNAKVGAGLGALAGLAPKGANAVLQKTLGKTGTVDPAAAIATTAKDTADAYAAMHQTPVGSNSLKNAYASATLTPGIGGGCLAWV